MTLVTNLYQRRIPVGPSIHVILSEGPLGPKPKDPPLEANHATAAVSTSRGRPFDSLRSLRVTRWGVGSLRVTWWGVGSRRVTWWGVGSRRVTWWGVGSRRVTWWGVGSLRVTWWGARSWNTMRNSPSPPKSRNHRGQIAHCTREENGALGAQHHASKWWRGLPARARVWWRGLPARAGSTPQWAGCPLHHWNRRWQDAHCTMEKAHTPRLTSHVSRLPSKLPPTSRLVQPNGSNLPEWFTSAASSTFNCPPGDRPSFEDLASAATDAPDTTQSQPTTWLPLPLVTA
jgi:hypothetical protein